MPRLILTILLAAVALCGAVPQPRSFFGHEMGADRTVLDWAKVVSYFRTLEQSSNRIRVVELGKSTGGRPFIAAWIASPQTLANLNRYQEIQRRLADPRLTTEAQAEQLAREGKAVVMITCSIHSTEIASSHTAVEFAYRLLTEDKPRFRAILDNTVFILVPSLNPDGMDIVTTWYRKTLNTPYEGTSPPELYQKYLGHDNNRDWYIHTQAETKLTVTKLHNVWHPQIVYDVHQQGITASRMFVPPWLDPIEPNVDPILVQGMNMMGTSIALDLTAAGKTGIAVNASYDFWTPARSYQSFHGGMRILSESASVRIASPVTLTRGELDRTTHGYNAQERSWNHIEPWQGGTWRLRDIVDYQLIAYESCLYNAAIHREDLLRNFYRIGRRQVTRKSPSAFVIPARQRDPGATRQLLQILEAGVVEIHRAPDGGYVIPMAQPYSGYAKALLEAQHYPDLRQYPGGPPKRPYDVTAHTLPMLMGVKVETAEKTVAGPRVQVSREGPGSSLAGADTDAWYNVNRIWASGKPVWRNMETGDFSAAQEAGWKQIDRPRVGLYRSHNPSMDEGWTRWILERFGFAYRSVKNPEILAGNLRAHYDVLVFPDQGMTAIENGYRPGAMPDEYTGGLGRKGADALRDFASAGGTLVFLNRSSEYAVERLGVKAQNVVKGAGNSEFYSPGSLLNATVDTRHPLCLGMPAAITVWSEHSPAWETGETVVARYPESGLLASGWLLGERYLAKRAAIVDARLGAGHVVLFGLLPQYRAQSYQGFKIFFNALLYR